MEKKRDGEEQGVSSDGIDYTLEGGDAGDREKSPTDDGYDEAAHSGASRYAVPEGEGGVFGTSGGGTYDGGFQIVDRPGLYDRSGAPGPFEPDEDEEQAKDKR